MFINIYIYAYKKISIQIHLFLNFNNLFLLKGVSTRSRIQNKTKRNINKPISSLLSRAAVVHLNFRAGSTFLVPVCTLPSSMERTSRCNKVDAVRLYASYRLNSLLPKGQRCVLFRSITYFVLLKFG